MSALALLLHFVTQATGPLRHTWRELASDWSGALALGLLGVWCVAALAAAGLSLRGRASRRAALWLVLAPGVLASGATWLCSARAHSLVIASQGSGLRAPHAAAFARLWLGELEWAAAVLWSAPLLVSLAWRANRPVVRSLGLCASAFALITAIAVGCARSQLLASRCEDCWSIVSCAGRAACLSAELAADGRLLARGQLGLLALASVGSGVLPLLCLRPAAGLTARERRACFGLLALGALAFASTRHHSRELGGPQAGAAAGQKRASASVASVRAGG
jgi:hypothetical protein